MLSEKDQYEIDEVKKYKRKVKVYIKELKKEIELDQYLIDVYGFNYAFNCAITKYKANN